MGFYIDNVKVNQSSGDVTGFVYMSLAMMMMDERHFARKVHSNVALISTLFNEHDTAPRAGGSYILHQY